MRNVWADKSWTRQTPSAVRAAAERSLSQSASDATTARIHAQLADQYDRLVARLGTGEFVDFDNRDNGQSAPTSA